MNKPIDLENLLKLAIDFGKREPNELKRAATRLEYHMELSSFTITALITRLIEAEKVIAFYADKTKWEAPTYMPESYETTCIDVSDEEDHGNCIIGGKRARSYQEKFKK